MHPRSFDIGCAVQVEDGVMVPVLREVDTKNMPELASEYADLVEQARARRLTEDQVKGGIATVTNFGTFGLTRGTPIPLPNETSHSWHQCRCETPDLEQRSECLCAIH